MDVKEELLNTHNIRSISGGIWKKTDNSNIKNTMFFAQQLNLPKLVSSIIAERCLGDINYAYNFIKPSIKKMLPNPFNMKDIDKALDRIIQAIESKERIGILGDYDVDGATSSALLKNYFNSIGCEVFVCIPDRIKDGYGPNSELMVNFKVKHKCNLCITVDCGTVAYAPLDIAHSVGLDVIVVDHHIGGMKLPKAVAVINPNRIDEEFDAKNVAAVGVSFLLLVALNARLKLIDFFKNQCIEAPNLMHCLDLVALGTVCDVMDLNNVNRAFVTQGLKIMNQRKNVGLKVALDILQINKVDTYHLGFLIGPRINAGGRIGKSDLGMRLLTTKSEKEAEEIFNELNILNEERKFIENNAVETCIHKLDNNISLKHDKCIVMCGNWHPGIIGIVAGRVKDRFLLPTVIISFFDNDEIGKASARSINGIDIGAAILDAKTENIILEGGGHAMAGGFSIHKDKINELISFFTAKFTKTIDSLNHINCYQDEIPINGVNVNLYNHLQILQPFGVGNPAPRFMIRNVIILQANEINDQHISCTIGDSKSNFYAKAFCFRALNTDIGNVLLQSKKLRDKITIFGKLNCNFWNGKYIMQFIIEDIAK